MNFKTSIANSVPEPMDQEENVSEQPTFLVNLFLSIL